ncbi:hypothetical protein [Litorisediminicola beolgyonensis]|uniref:Tail fiber protein n=1 Tax=Litorisediminicola beolgyonensis TaxID=1173614 RepID=A0ABW3ZJM1_9RHOB
MAWYKTGTVAVTNGSGAVTGTGTDWFAALQVGWGFVGPDGRVYEITSVNSATSITITPTYQGSTASAQSYAAFPTRSLQADLADAVNQLITDYQASLDGPGAGLFADGTPALPGIAFDADPDTGLARPGSNQLGFYTAGVLRALLIGSGFTINVPILGTAVTQSITDATSGRLLKVGDFGLGAGSPPSISDFTASLKPGFYRYLEQSATGAPGGGFSYNGHALVLKSASGTVIFASREANAAAGQKSWVGARTADPGSITWYQIVTQAQLLGTVSQSDGVPTGAVIERGSNGNGEYVRFADGTQICTDVVSFNPTLATGYTAFSFPASFANGDISCAFSSVETNLGANKATLGDMYVVNNSTQWKVHHTQATGGTNFDVKLLAIGRWF